jgi:hypothetical protein
MNTNGSNQTRLTFSQGHDGGANFSPDGSKIAFQRDRGNNDLEIYAMNSDGTLQNNLTNDLAAIDHGPDWGVAGVDTTPPETTIDSGPSGAVGTTSATFTFSATGSGATFECSLDEAAFEVCTSPKEYASLASGSHTFQVKATDWAGNTDATPAERTFTVDATAPIASPPAQSLVLNSQLGTNTVPVRLAWSATDALSGVENHTLQQSTNGGTYADVSLPTPTATTLAPSLGPGQTYQHRVQASDRASNLSAWQTGPSFTVDLRQERHQAVSYTGTWNLQAASTASGGYTKCASASGAGAKFSFAGRNVAWVAPTGPNRGKAEVWIDGVKAATIATYTPTPPRHARWCSPEAGLRLATTLCR